MNVYAQRSSITRYQREALNYFVKKGFTLPDLQTIRQNFNWNALQQQANAKTGKSLRDLVKEQVVSQGYFKLNRNVQIPGLTHYRNLQKQEKINRQIRGNLAQIKGKPSKYYKPFDISSIRGVDAQTVKRAYDRALRIMDTKTTDKLLGRYVGAYGGLLTSIANALGTNTRLVKDILIILGRQHQVMSTAWTSVNPKITGGVQAAAAYLDKIENALPNGVEIGVLYSSDEYVIKVYLMDIILAVGLDPANYTTDIQQIMRHNGGMAF